MLASGHRIGDTASVVGSFGSRGAARLRTRTGRLRTNPAPVSASPHLPVHPIPSAAPTAYPRAGVPAPCSRSRLSRPGLQEARRVVQAGTHPTSSRSLRMLAMRARNRKQAT
ncbi:hypothetical protein K438DRAFT_1840765 [Mycena galopus ATCC 62051]|nr:hypothetical protein K438DRAFT_1840765 [Mycena galopus ATCC 62051]